MVGSVGARESNDGREFLHGFNELAIAVVDVP
jgi:hypothetical protein